MAAGRAERLWEQTGQTVAICRVDTLTDGAPRYPRSHDAWTHHPEIDAGGPQQIIDCATSRPYIKHWRGRQVIFNHDYRPRAGRVYLTQQEWDFNTIQGPYAIIAPQLKPEASPNKSWGIDRWEAVIKDFPIPVFQLLESDRVKAIEGAQGIATLTFRHALSIIAGAAVVMTNEGGSHHMAASMRVPAVVFFGSFTPPQVTGYAFHYNMAVETPEGYCGRWDTCPHCNAAKRVITPAMMREKALLMVDAYGRD